MCHLFRAKQRDERTVASLSCYGKPPQLGVTDVAEPRQQSVTTSCAQYLLRGPQSVASPRSTHDREIFEINTGRRQCRCIGQMRWREPDNAPPVCRKSHQCRKYQLQLADAFAPTENFGQRTDRPASARQFAIQRSKAGRYRPSIS